MNVIRFLLGVTAVVALTGFAPAVSIAEEPVKSEKMICTPLVYEHELGGNFQRIGVLKLERELPSNSPTFYWRIGAQLFEAYTMDTHQSQNLSIGVRSAEYASALSPTFEIGRKSTSNSLRSVGFYSSFGLLSTEPIIDVGIALRNRWGVVKAGFFKTNRERYRGWDGGYEKMYGGEPAAMTYISFGIGPSFRF